jgi:hypothetical protein
VTVSIVFMRCLGKFAAALVLLAGTALTAFAAILPAAATAAPAPATPRLSHVFLIMEENNGYGDVIGNKAAPNLNYLAKTFGIETGYYGVSPCCSESNYVQLLGGRSYPTVNSDDAYWKNKITGSQPNLIRQLDSAGISWKAYLQALPYAGYQGICYPAKCNGAPDSDPLYVSKHDGIQNFTDNWNAYDWSRQVPGGQLAADLKSGAVPRFGYIVPDECHDMHGDPPYCLDSGNIFDPQNQHLVAAGDAYLGTLVHEITSAAFWAKSDNAIIITFDEGDDSKGCCDANPGAGHVATIVVTSHGPRGVTDHQLANHYSTLATIEGALGLPCINLACDTRHVTPMSDLIAVTGAKAIPTRVLTERSWPTPTPPFPLERLGSTKAANGAGGWSVQRAGLLGTNDNSLGAVAASSPADVWAVGDYLPDAATSNQDATLSFAEHYNGKKWTVSRPPSVGSNFSSLYGVAAVDGRAWGVGEYLNKSFQDRALVDVWDGKAWHVAGVPQPGSQRDMLFAASAPAPGDVWVAGDQEGPNGIFRTLVEHFNGTTWSVKSTPNPGAAGDHLYAIDALSYNDVWAAGEQNVGAGVPDQPLVEHWNGRTWSVVRLPASTTAGELLDSVLALPDHQVFVAGEKDSPAGGGQPLIEHYVPGRGWSVQRLPKLPGSANWGNLYGLAAARGAIWAVGTYVDPASDNNAALVLKGSGGRWSQAAVPVPGSGSDLPGGVVSVGGQLWYVGVYDTGGSRLPLVVHRAG